MAKRRKIIVGNWKMNGHLTAGLTLAKELATQTAAVAPAPYDLVICPPATLTWPIAEVLMGSPVKLGGQNCHFTDHGAFTGDVSAAMLADLGCAYVIVGHSERRKGYSETNEDVAKKVTAAQLAGLTAILCVGETKEEKAAGKTQEVIETQVRHSIPEGADMSRLIVAYEPVWAIGSGEQPEVPDIERVHRTIRRTLGAPGETVRVLYGGSVAPQNAGSLLGNSEIDGALVGGASLNADGFFAIAEKAREA